MSTLGENVRDFDEFLEYAVRLTHAFTDAEGLLSFDVHSLRHSEAVAKGRN